MPLPARPPARAPAAANPKIIPYSFLSEVRTPDKEGIVILYNMGIITASL